MHQSLCGQKTLMHQKPDFSRAEKAFMCNVALNEMALKEVYPQH